MNKEVWVHIYNGILAIKRNKFESVAVRWMNTESVIQSEVRKRKTNIIYIRIHKESRKIVLMNLFTEKKWRHRRRGTAGEGEAETN